MESKKNHEAGETSGNIWTVDDLKQGLTLFVRRIVEEETALTPAEIQSVRKKAGRKEFYVHYVGYNKRLDEWVDQDQLDLSSVDDPTARKKQKRKQKLSADAGKPKPVTPIKNFDEIEIGRYRLKTWYFSPYPKQLAAKGKIYLCEYCLTFTGCKTSLARHLTKCQRRCPPGNEIYR
jgi:histone acetyltransferase HTATIP